MFPATRNPRYNPATKKLEPKEQFGPGYRGPHKDEVNYFRSMGEKLSFKPRHMKKAVKKMCSPNPKFGKQEQRYIDHCGQIIDSWS